MVFFFFVFLLRKRANDVVERAIADAAKSVGKSGKNNGTIRTWIVRTRALTTSKNGDAEEPYVGADVVSERPTLASGV